MIDPGLQSAMARSMHAHVVSVSSSHVPQLSKPVQVADAILSAAQQVK